MNETLNGHGVHPYRVALDGFEGPLDLLLHLIKENQVDIYHIPVAKITDQYLETLEMMETLNLEVAGEFLLMAATLAHIKSKLLLPPDESQEDPEDEGRDPREELVRRILEYQKYKNAAQQLLARPILGRDVFKRELTIWPRRDGEEAPELMEVSLFKLVDAFSKVLKRLELIVPNEVEREGVSVADCVSLVIEKLRSSPEGTLRFDDLFENPSTKERLVSTFLALLELVKRGMVRVFQADAFSDISLMGTAHLHGEWKHGQTDEYSGKPDEINS